MLGDLLYSISSLIHPLKNYRDTYPALQISIWKGEKKVNLLTDDDEISLANKVLIEKYRSAGVPLSMYSSTGNFCRNSPNCRYKGK